MERETKSMLAVKRVRKRVRDGGREQGNQQEEVNRSMFCGNNLFTKFYARKVNELKIGSFELKTRCCADGISHSGKFQRLTAQIMLSH